MSIALNKDRFVNLYTTIDGAVKLIGEGKRDGGRGRMKWLSYDKARLEDLLKKTKDELPYNYLPAHVYPLIDNLGLVKIQTNSDLLENLIGSIVDLSDPDQDDNGDLLYVQLQRFLAIASNLTRSFLAGQVRQRAGLDEIKTWLPPLATFKYKSTNPSIPSPYIFPSDESRLLFGGSVGIIVLPATYRSHPVLWAGLSHEVGGHDVLHADRTLLPQLELGVYRLFAEAHRGETETRAVEFLRLLNQETRESIEFLGRLWRYWIGEAAADICAILNMGPAFALNSAIYTAVFNKQMAPWIKQDLRTRKDAIDQLLKTAGRNEIQAGIWRIQFNEIENRLSLLPQKEREMEFKPVLRVSPPYRGDKLDTHPSDVLRLYVMIGAIEKLRRLDQSVTEDYVTMIEDIIQFCITGSDGLVRKDETVVKLRGFLQISSDVWIEVPDGNNPTIPNGIPLYRMKEYAKAVGRHIVTEPLKALKGATLQDIVTWDDDHETVARKIRDRLLKEDAAVQHSIDNIGDDAQLLAGSTLALFERPALYEAINRRLEEALDMSFYRDEVWGNSGDALARSWWPPSS
jgi:hypothetical protein